MDKVIRSDVLWRMGHGCAGTTTRRASTRPPWPASRSTGFPVFLTSLPASCGRGGIVRCVPVAVYVTWPGDRPQQPRHPDPRQPEIFTSPRSPTDTRDLLD